MWGTTSIKGKIPDNIKNKPSINDAPNKFQTAVLNVETKKGGIILQKDDKPTITFYKDYGTVEITTLERDYIFSLNNIESIEYDPDKCDIYYQ